MPAGNNLLACEGLIHLFPSEDGRFEVDSISWDDSIEKVECIGHLNHLKAYEGSSDGLFSAEDEKYTVECKLPEHQIRSLLSSIRAGEGPQSVTIQVVSGLDSGMVPDGSAMEWVDAKVSRLPIGNITFLHEVDHDVAESEAELADELGEAPIATDDRLANLEANLESVVASLNAMRGQLSWIVTGAVAGAIGALAITAKLY